MKIKGVKKELQGKGYYNISTTYCNNGKKPLCIRAENEKEVITVWLNGMVTSEGK